MTLHSPILDLDDVTKSLLVQSYSAMDSNMTEVSVCGVWLNCMDSQLVFVLFSIFVLISIYIPDINTSELGTAPFSHETFAMQGFLLI